MNEILVLVCGRAGSGKSAICEEIAHALIAAGFGHVAVEKINDEEAAFSHPDMHEMRVKAIQKRGVSIRIQERPTYPAPSASVHRLGIHY